MESGLNVNADPETDNSADIDPLFFDTLPVSAPSPGDQGPCLYLGPAGQRCDRRAIEGGFCSRHQPGGARALSVQQVSRRALGVVGLLAVLWPVLADLIRELVRLLR
jgi:hypothetical protein